MSTQSRKTVIVAIDDAATSGRVQRLLAQLDVEVVVGQARNLQAILHSRVNPGMVITELAGRGAVLPATLEHDLAEAGEVALLAIVDKELLDGLRLPVQVRSDFVVQGASEEEFSTRVKLLLWPGTEASSSDILVMGNLTINLATYQVKIGDEVADFTYLEYALLSFLVTHPGRAYSREVLLQRIWGYEYFGGTRTVDVHVRRIRAKLGTELGAKLETVRGVGYMWNM